jgi:hypothetical protein
MRDRWRERDDEEREVREHGMQETCPSLARLAPIESRSQASIPNPFRSF